MNHEQVDVASQSTCETVTQQPDLNTGTGEPPNPVHPRNKHKGRFCLRFPEQGNIGEELFAPRRMAAITATF